MYRNMVSCQKPRLIHFDDHSAVAMNFSKTHFYPLVDPLRLLSYVCDSAVVFNLDCLLRFIWMFFMKP